MDKDLTVEKPECHMLYNVTTMATTWSCVAMTDKEIKVKDVTIPGHGFYWIKGKR